MAVPTRNPMRASRRGRRLRTEALEPRRLLAADPIITEFAATNSGVLLDGFGASPDWVEVFNRGDASLDLAGYSLTDDADETDKWVFPQTTLEPGEYLVVFASGLDTTDPGGHLHTNSGLSAEGDYIALANPSGVVLSEFGAGGQDYPLQATNDTFGLEFDSETTQVVSPGSAAQHLVPSGPAVDATWTSPSFDDSTWSAGTASLGNEAEPGLYEDLIDTVLPGGTRSAYVRIPFHIGEADAKLGSLRLRFDDGFVAYLNGSPIADFNAPEHVGYDSRATEFRPREAAVEEAAFYVGDHSDLLVVGENVLAIHLLDAVDSPSEDLLLTAELTVASGHPIAPAAGPLMAATPGQPNTLVRSSDVSFSRASGVFAGSFPLTISAGSGETIRYTLDGSLPDTSSPVHTGPITIDATTRVRAQSFGHEGRLGRVSTAAYTQASVDEIAIGSTLPILVLENFGQGLSGREYQDAHLSLYDVDPGTGRSSLGDAADLTTPIGQHRRGSSSFSSPKYSLRVELRDENGNDKDRSLLGMPADADWILYGPAEFEQALIRNTVVYDLSNQAGLYAVRTRYVELYNNIDGGSLTEDEYFGIYVLMENIKIGEERVDLAELSPADTSASAVSGGYIFKQDRADSEEDSSWTTDRSRPIGLPQLVHASPSRENLTQKQVDTLRDSIQDFEDALYGPNSTDPELGYAAHIDTDSWIDHHLLRVFANDDDTLFLSEHFSKDRDGKIEAGPLWDFDRSSGRQDGAAPTAWRRSNFRSAQWWGTLFDDPDFTQLWVDRWWDLRESVLSNDNLAGTVDAHAEEIADATPRNFERWSEFPPSSDGFYARPGSTGWDAEIEHLAGWLVARAGWIDEQMTPLTQLSAEGGQVEPGFTVTLTNEDPAAAVYYTLDGTDPRGDGGAPSASALVYSGPVTINGTAELRARSFNPANSGRELGPWSAATSGRFITETPADATNLRVSELHYNPLDPTAAELSALPGIDNNSFEFVELLNVGDTAIDLDGVRFTDGIDFDFSRGDVLTAAPGETVLIVQNRDAFELRYGTGLPVAGEYDGRLSGGGEEIEIVDRLGDPIAAFEYSDDSPWPEDPDGDGPSLEAIDPIGDPNDPANWRASLVDGGTPGAATPPLLGDYDRSGLVDHADRTLWAAQFGATVAAAGVGADGNRDGVVDAADYTVWRDNEGAAVGSPGEAAFGDGWVGEGVSGRSTVASAPASPATPATTDQATTRIDRALQAWRPAPIAFPAAIDHAPVPIAIATTGVAEELALLIASSSATPRAGDPIQQATPPGLDAEATASETAPEAIDNALADDLGSDLSE